MSSRSLNITRLLCAVAWTLAPNPLPAATTNVAFGTYFFNPKDVTIEVGDTVVWSNQGGSHTVTGTGADPICGAVLVPVSCSHTFEVAGDFPYICAVAGHASLGMTGIVRVVQAPPMEATLTGPGLTPEGDFQFTVTSTAKRTNIVEATTNAANPAAWTTLLTLVPTNATFQVTDTNTSAFQIRFYRVVQPD